MIYIKKIKEVDKCIAKLNTYIKHKENSIKVIEDIENPVRKIVKYRELMITFSKLLYNMDSYYLLGKYERSLLYMMIKYNGYSSIKSVSSFINRKKSSYVYEYMFILHMESKYCERLLIGYDEIYYYILEDFIKDFYDSLINRRDNLILEYRKNIKDIQELLGMRIEYLNNFLI